MLSQNRPDQSRTSGPVSNEVIEAGLSRMVPEFKAWAAEWLTEHGVEVLEDNQATKDTVRQLVDVVWLESDGSVSAEGAVTPPAPVDTVSPRS